jgi:aspartate/methionine/tyrosine aminotransferase
MLANAAKLASQRRKDIMAKLAINGGEKAITVDPSELVYDRALTDDELTEAVLELVRGGVLFSEESFPGETILEFEREFAKWRGVKYALAHTNGTSAIQAGLFAVGVGPGDEVIVPSYTHPFSVVPILGANAIPVFCDVDPETLCADPAISMTWQLWRTHASRPGLRIRE